MILFFICWITLPVNLKIWICKKQIGLLVLGSFGMKSGGFHGHEIWQIPWWNLADFMEFGRFHGHEIWQISWWNPADFMAMKSSRFHGEIWQISCQMSQELINTLHI